MKQFLEDQKSKGQIKSYAVTGVKASPHNEIFLYALLFGMAKKTQWNTEADIVTAIDWPAPGAPVPQGRVTVRIDHQGAASAELIATGPVPTVTKTTFAAGSAKLIGDFGFATVAGWSGQNPKKDAAEISDVLAALKLLKKNISALKGVELIRVSSLTNAKNEAGEFSAGSHVALGDKADVMPYLKLADLAFGSDDVQFFGGGPNSPTVPASFQTILHEVGHAVEQEQVRLAREDYITAHVDVEAAKKVLTDASATYNAELKEAQRKGKRAVNEFYKKQGATYEKNTAADRDANASQNVATGKLNDTSDKATGHTKRLQKFIQLVKDNDIRRFTEYSDKNWPQKPDEFYAEAYSLWLVDPAFLSKNYKVVYNFFQDGDYLK